MQILEQTNLEAFKLAKKIGPKKVIELMKKKGMVGRGGAAFPTATKWEMALKNKSKEVYFICNADEGEPGTFKDKFILMHNPETFIEGILIASYVLGAKTCFIYLRKEYDTLRPRLEKKIKQIIEKTKSKTEIIIVRGAGSYVCGEETAIMQSIMGYRGQPTYKPPYPTEKGLWDKPTVLNNVETITCIPQLILFNDWNPNIRLFSISGQVENPGVYEWEMGIKMPTIIDTVKPTKKVKAISLGCFGGIMPVGDNTTLNYDLVCKKDCGHGAFTCIFIGEDQNIVEICLSIAKFYTYESCGKCTPCREGTIRMLNLLKKIRDKKANKEDLVYLEELANHVQETSICGLGQSCGNHILTALKHFKKDFREYIK